VNSPNPNFPIANWCESTTIPNSHSLCLNRWNMIFSFIHSDTLLIQPSGRRQKPPLNQPHLRSENCFASES
jgi:hypothetical protein